MSDDVDAAEAHLSKGSSPFHQVPHASGCHAVFSIGEPKLTPF